jgi:hypothetical protein
MKKLIFFAVITLLLAGCSGADNSEIQETTVYSKYCTDFDSDIFDCPKTKGMRIMKRDIKVFLKEQMVISNGVWVSKMNTCEVFDKNNWRCEDGNHYESMSNGEYFESGYSKYVIKDGKSTLIIVQLQISAIEYYIKQLMTFL